MNVSRVVRACVRGYLEIRPDAFTSADITAYYGLDDLGSYAQTSVGEQAVRNALAQAVKNGWVRACGKDGKYIVYSALYETP